MNAHSQTAFLLLIIAQAAHSLEEYTFGLYDVLAPARFISSLLSNDRATGFAIFNIALVLFGLWCYITRVRPNRPSALSLAWMWLVMEAANGIGHMVLGLVQGDYFPGLITAPLLLAISVYLAIQISRTHRA